jgi:Flagellar biosynthesis protein, FliO
MKSPGGTPEMDLSQAESARMKIIPSYDRLHLTRVFMLGAKSLKAVWGSVVSHAISKRKTLCVRETAALGDRRFVSVIQFEHRRFLIGSSPGGVTLLASLPDEPVSGEAAGEQKQIEQ